MPRIITLLTLLGLLICPAWAQDHLLDEGVSWELAQFRKDNYQDLAYSLSFSIPESKSERIEGEETISLHLDTPQDIILDFRVPSSHVHSVSVGHGEGDFRTCRKWQFTQEHILIPKRYTRQGVNRIRIAFTAGNQSINRREGYVYTLFVPDRARTAFPCIDQPNMKARFSLELEIPTGWTAVANGQETAMPPNPHRGGRAAAGRKRMSFAMQEPIPTYLFAFAAGDFQFREYTEDGHTLGAYYRETDTARIAQLPEIMHQVVFSMRWQEEFTGVKYPFPKYDLVILPGFQFGGMEHVGATFYNDNTIFLPANPTPDEKLRRTELIAHETSHMWFGDAVTMNWFDDVWTKEVFANYFAAEITAPLFPELNHELNWLKTYTAAAISQDRTEGRTSIRQPLDNMRHAGLIYNSIIYNKAPVMMRKMVELMGKEAFRRGIRRYVQEHLYGNATWHQLIDILDAETEVDLRAFSQQWVDRAYWPHLHAASTSDPRIGKEYGYMELSLGQCDTLLHTWQAEKDGTRRQALIMTLYENYLHHKIDDTRMMTALADALSAETDPLTALTLVNYMREPLLATLSRQGQPDKGLLQLAHTHPLPAVRTQLLRLLGSQARTPEVVAALYDIWKQNKNTLLSENDYMTLAYELAMHYPDRAEDILATQRSRLNNADRLAQFDFISRAVNPSSEVRDSLFASLAIAENRRIEPWTLSVLYYLNHPLRDQESVKYIRPALEMLPDIQRTGDIFFPGNWCSSLLSGHRSPEACRAVEDYLSAHPEMMPLLRNKVLQATYFLQRSNAAIH